MMYVCNAPWHKFAVTRGQFPWTYLVSACHENPPRTLQRLWLGSFSWWREQCDRWADVVLRYTGPCFVRCSAPVPLATAGTVGYRGIQTGSRSAQVPLLTSPQFWSWPLQWCYQSNPCCRQVLRGKCAHIFPQFLWKSIPKLINRNQAVTSLSTTQWLNETLDILLLLTILTRRCIDNSTHKLTF